MGDMLAEEQVSITMSIHHRAPLIFPISQNAYSSARGTASAV